MDLSDHYRASAARLLNEHGFDHQGEPEFEWSYDDRVFLWSVASEHHEAAPIWILTGDCPSDYLQLQPAARTKRDAVVLFAQRYAYVARALREGQLPEIIVTSHPADPRNDRSLIEKLESYSALLYSLVDAGKVD